MNLTESTRKKLALAVAATADLVQITLWPIFLPGGANPVDDVLDLVVAGVMWYLLGWHYAFLPAMIAKVVPGLDLAPTWTAAALLAMNSKPNPTAPEAPVDKGKIIDV